MNSFVGTILLGLAILSSAATVPPMGSINLSDDGIPVLNASQLGAIDPRFTMTHRYNGQALNEDHCLMNIVYLLSELSVLDFTSSIDPTVGMGAKYPDVVTVLDARAPRRTIETRLFIWGLYAAATLMIAQNIFQTAEFTLKWDGTAVGTITLMKATSTSSGVGSNATDVLAQESQVPDIIPITMGTSTNDSYSVATTNTTDNLGIEGLSVAFTGFRNPLPRQDVYMTVMKSLLYIAEKSDTDELLPFQIVAPRPYNAILRMTQYRPTQPTGETFTYGWASQALPAIPQTLLQHGWREASFEVLVDGVPVGKGALVKGTR